jgi:hypothetical protein
MKESNQVEGSEGGGDVLPELPEETGAPCPTPYELATLAARIAPGLCHQHPTEAINAAIALVEAAKETIDLKRMERELEITTEQLDKELDKHADDPASSPFRFGYERGIKKITKENNWSRALEKVREFESRGRTKRAVDKLFAAYRENGFTGAKINKLRGDFGAWWEKEKSRKARESRAARKNNRRSEIFCLVAFLND